MSVEDTDPPATYISHTGVVRSGRELERGAWEYSTPTDLTETPVVVNGTRYYPVTPDSVFLVEYTFGVDEYQQIATDIRELNARFSNTGESLQGDSTDRIQFTFITDDGKTTRTLAESQVHSVEPTATPEEHFPITGRTSREKARQLEKYAGLHPYAVTPSHITPLLSTSDEEVQRAAIAALRHIIDERASECVDATHHLRQLLSGVAPAVQTDAVYCLAHIAETAPEDAVIASTGLVEHITANDKERRENAFRACTAIADDDAAFLTGHEQTIAQRLHANSRTEREYAAKLLAVMASETPNRVSPFTPQLIDRLTETPDNFDEKIAAMSALGRVSRENPDSTIAYVDDIASCLTAGHEKLRANTASTLYDIADMYPEDVAPYINKIAALLTGKTEYAKLNATGALARLAKTHPEAVSEYTEALIPCLHCDRKAVRVNTCWVFERMGSYAVAAEEALLEAAATDADADVQTRAYWAAESVVTEQSKRDEDS